MRHVGSPFKNYRKVNVSNCYSFTIVPNLGNGHLIIDRKQWGSIQIDESSTKAVPLAHPIPYVIITHIGVQSKPCDNVYNCSIKMRTIQDSAIAERGLIDMPANFYVSEINYITKILTHFD